MPISNGSTVQSAILIGFTYGSGCGYCSSSCKQAQLFLAFVRVQTPRVPDIIIKSIFRRSTGEALKFYEKGSAKEKGPLDGLPR
jgi:hypothetical protein